MASQVAEDKGYRRLVITPLVMGEIAKHFWEKRELFPYSLGAEPERLTRILTADDTAVFEIGDFGGILYFTEVMPGPECSEHQEPTASAHIFIWDKKWYGKSSILNELCRDFMRAFEIRRLYVEIQADNQLAILAATNVGFRLVGTVRKRMPAKQGPKDSVLMDALIDDLEAAIKHDAADIGSVGDVRLVPVEGEAGGTVIDGLRSRSALELGIDPYASGETHYWIIEADGVPSGYTGIHSIDFPSKRCRGCLWIAPEYRHAGIGEKALRLRNDLLFERYGMHRIEWAVRIDNAPMVALSDRLAGEREGTLRQPVFHDGAYHDYAIYALLRPEEGE